MKAIQIKEYVKSPADLKANVVTVPNPVPKADEYLVSVRAAAANFFDILQVQGKYQHQPPFPVCLALLLLSVLLVRPCRRNGGNFRMGFGDWLMRTTLRADDAKVKQKSLRRQGKYKSS